jgi:hypothetical protein
VSLRGGGEEGRDQCRATIGSGIIRWRHAVKANVQTEMMGSQVGVEDLVKEETGVATCQLSDSGIGWLRISHIQLCYEDLAR